MAFAVAIVVLYVRSYYPINHWALGPRLQIPKEETYALRVRHSTH